MKPKIHNLPRSNSGEVLNLTTKVMSKTTTLLQSLYITLALITTCLWTSSAYGRTQNTEHMKKKILFVVTSHNVKGSTGEPTGFYLSEVAHPWYVLTKAGYEIDFVSPKGGKAPVDGFSLEDRINRKFWEDTFYRSKIEHTMKPSEVNAGDYVAIHYAGGHGAMWDFPDNTALASLAAGIYENGGIVSAVCHGPAGLVNVRLSNGNYLVKGKRINAFTNEEEVAVKLNKVVPFLLESTLSERGAIFEKSEPGQAHVAVDQRVVTGQNPQSANAVGEAIVNQLAGEKFDESVSLITRYEVKKGHRNIFRRELRRYVRRAARKYDNIMAEGYVEQQTPSVMWVIERWSSKAALEKNRKRVKYRIISQISKYKLTQPPTEYYVKDLEPLSKQEWKREASKEEKSLTIMLFVDGKQGTEENFREIYLTALPQFRSEPGVVNYQLSQLADDNTRFVTYEKFRNEDAFQYHLKFPPIQPVLDYLNTSIQQPPFQNGLHRLIMFAPIRRK